MPLLIVALAVMLTGPARGDVPPPPPFDYPEYVDRDPYYSDEFDALKACAERQAPSYRYDYNRPQVSSAEQIAELLRRTCTKEIEALAKLVSPLERSGSPAEITGLLDDLIVAPLIAPDWQSGRTPDLADAPPPGTSVLSLESRTTYFRAAQGFTPDERVSVWRTDAFNAPNYIVSFDQRFNYGGHQDSWRYSYLGSYDIWYGSISKDGVTATIVCSQAYRGVVSWADHCDLKVGQMIWLKSRGRRLYPLSLCNPGHFDSSDVLLRPPPPRGSPRSFARAATLSIDGEAAVPLPDGSDCRTIDAALLSRIATAKRLSSSFIAREDTRTMTIEGKGEAVARALPLLERLHAQVFDARTANETLTSQLTLYHRAHPFTVRDALLARDEWHGSVSCVVNRALSTGGDAVAIDAAMQAPDCAAWLADLDWRAVSFRSSSIPPADGAASAPGGPAKIAEARTLLRNEVRDLLARGWRPSPRPHFAPSEAPAQVMGHAGFAGHAETTREGAGSAVEPFGYAIEGRRAWAVVPSRYFSTMFGALPPPSITISCDADRRPACTIRIPTDDRKGAFELHTEGPWHATVPCLSYAGTDLTGWRIFGGKYAKPEESGLLDAKGCVTDRRAIVTRAVIEQSVGPVLVKPGGDPYESDVLLNFQNVTFALALTRFLSDRIRATN